MFVTYTVINQEAEIRWEPEAPEDIAPQTESNPSNQADEDDLF